MSSSSRPTYEEILAEAQGLDLEQQLRLLEGLAVVVRRAAGNRRQHSILELQGLGKGTWQGVNAQEYVHQERSAWSG